MAPQRPDGSVLLQPSLRSNITCSHIVCVFFFVMFVFLSLLVFRSPHYACPEVIRVSDHHSKNILLIGAMVPLV